ncbi:MAG TPA: holo-[acyl-carrier-protein] synthase [bacterium]|nr:holo-[acyl-carrier-protein] synthase [bacterium]
MILGTGVDIIEIERVARIIEQYGDPFCQRLFTAREREYCSSLGSAKSRAQCYAARFAAKESFFKALGTGLRGGLKWTDVAVVHDERGKPVLYVEKEAEKRIREARISVMHVSLSHERTHAIAVVILETTP